MFKKEKSKNTRYLYIVLIVVIVILYMLSFGKFFLNEGDHGRDLLGFLMTSEGGLPYIDYNWIYGPLMPFYYGLLFKILSPSILIASVGWYFIFTLAIVMFYITVRDSFNSLIAFIATLLFVVYHGFYYHTFNHVGGTLIIIAILFCFIRFIRTEEIKYLHLTSLCLVLLGLIKFNMLLAMFMSCLIGVFLISKKELFKFVPSVIVPLVFIYGGFILLSGGYRIESIFPYSSKLLMASPDPFIVNILKPLYIAPSIASIKSVIILGQYNVLYSKLAYFVVFLISLVTLVSVYKDKKQFHIMLFLVIATILTMHEFVMVGTDYSLRMWTLPILLLSVVYSVMYWVESRLKVQKVVFGVVVYIALFGFLVNVLIYSANFKALSLERARVDVYPVSFVPFVSSVTQYIQANTTVKDKVLVIPYNTLYLFLSDRRSPSKQNEFLYLSGVDEDKENRVIEDLKASNTPLILYSNMVSEEGIGTGYFGKTHCKKLGNYLLETYVPSDVVPEFFNKEKNLAYGRVITFFKKK